MPLFKDGLLRPLKNLRQSLKRSLPPSTKRNLRSFHEESLDRYQPGGYHPVRIGDRLHGGQYEVVNKLGYGVYSTVWLARSTSDDSHVALKILTADSSTGEGHTFEQDILNHFITLSRSASAPPAGADNVLGLLDHFQHPGPHGLHTCLVQRPLGPSLSLYRTLFPGLRIPPRTVKSFAKQLLGALCFLHDTCRVIHTDIKPQNILIETPELNEMFRLAPSQVFSPQTDPLEPPLDFYRESEPVITGEEDLKTAQDVSVKLTDFGVASWIDQHLTEWIQPQMLRAPEVILGSQWDEKVDIWNLGLVIWELLHAQLCFDGQATADADYSPAAHLAQMVAILGGFPGTLLARCPAAAEFFDAEGQLSGGTSFPPRSPRDMSDWAGALEGPEQDAFLEFMQGALALEPRERLSARQLLQSEWLQGA